MNLFKRQTATQPVIRHQQCSCQTEAIEQAVRTKVLLDSAEARVTYLYRVLGVAIERLGEDLVISEEELWGTHEKPIEVPNMDGNYRLAKRREAK